MAGRGPSGIQAIAPPSPHRPAARRPATGMGQRGTALLSGNGSPVIWPSSDRGRRGIADPDRRERPRCLGQQAGTGAGGSAAANPRAGTGPACCNCCTSTHRYGAPPPAWPLVNGEQGELSYAGIGNTRICLRGHEPWRGASPATGCLGTFPHPGLLQRQPLVAGTW